MKLSQWQMAILLNPAIYAAIFYLYTITLSQRIPAIVNYIISGILVVLCLVTLVYSTGRQLRDWWNDRPWKKK